ncbi:hypothetical protein GJAV_G00247540 [Gymnothorax javanicus]|nr:hypothetical protein GJAV_G00247540 [Gymnothorax javanicus]
MEKTCFILCLILSLAAGLLDKSRKSQVYTMPVLGVFEVAFMPSPNKMSYGFNAIQAREVCESLNVTIASKQQVVDAHRNGLETCRFGWIDEQIAVIPRINPSAACGQNQTGVIIWRASVNKLFDVFCFNSSALEMHLIATATKVPRTTTQVPGIFPSSLTPTSAGLRQPLYSTVFLSVSSSTKHDHQLRSSSESFFGVVPTAIVITVITVLLLAAVAAFWGKRKTKNSGPLWEREPGKEGTKMELWKSTCEKELNWSECDEKRAREKSNSGPNANTEAQAEMALEAASYEY